MRCGLNSPLTEKMHRLLRRNDIVVDIGNQIIIACRYLRRIAIWTGYCLKVFLYDATIIIKKLPFGNIISIVYFTTAVYFLKNMVEGGEFARVLFRAIYIYFIQRTPFSVCMKMLLSYIAHIMKPIVHIIWKYTGEPLKQSANEFITEHSDRIEKSVVEMVKTAAFATLASSISKELIAHLGPAAIDAFAKSDIAKTILDIRQNTGRIDTILDTVQMRLESATSQQSRIEYAVQSLTDNLNSLSLNMANEQYLLENDIAIQRKLTEISMQIEYLRVMQPSKLDRILNAVSISNIFTSIANIDVSHSASQLGRRRLENNE